MKNEYESASERISQFIDTLNHEEKPIDSTSHSEKDDEFEGLMDTVMAVRTLKNIEVPPTPIFMEEKSRKKRNPFIRYGSLAACLLIAAIVFSESYSKFIGRNNSSKKESCQVNNYTSEQGSSPYVTKSYQEDKRNKNSTDNIEGDNSYSNGTENIPKGEDISLDVILDSCRPMMDLYKGMPDEMSLQKSLALTNSPYTYFLRYQWGTENEFLDLYILPGREGYGIMYKNRCFSIMDGIIEEGAGKEPMLSYGRNVYSIGWSGKVFSVAVISSKGYLETEDLIGRSLHVKLKELAQEEIRNKRNNIQP